MADNDSFTSNDTFDNPHEKALYNLNTATDGSGVERIISASTDEFIPAPLESSKEEKDAAKRREAMFDKASKQRQAQLKGEVKDEDRAVNNPSDGGSQSTIQTVAERDKQASEARKAEAQKRRDSNKDDTATKSEATK